LTFSTPHSIREWLCLPYPVGLIFSSSISKVFFSGRKLFVISYPGSSLGMGPPGQSRDLSDTFCRLSERNPRYFISLPPRFSTYDTDGSSPYSPCPNISPLRKSIQMNFFLSAAISHRVLYPSRPSDSGCKRMGPIRFIFWSLQRFGNVQISAL